MPKMNDFYEEYWRWREDNWNLHKMGIVAERHKFAVKVICEELKINSTKENINVLDIGCGEGIFGKILRERVKSGVSIVGVDISKKAIELSKPFYDEVHTLNVDEVRLSNIFNTKFNFVICFEVMEHIIYPERFLEEIYTLLKNDGKLITSIPNFAFLKNRITVLRGNFPYEQHIFHSAEHIHYFTFYSFKKLLNEKGFNVISTEGSNFALLPPLTLLPLDIQKRIFYKFPNLFGKQIVFYCEKKLIGDK